MATGSWSVGEMVGGLSGGGHRPIWSYDLPDQISRQLEMDIMSGKIPRGTHLHQEKLCERFGVSRTPIREALRKLQAAGLVVFVANRGVLVRIFERSEVVQLYEVRAELEGFAGQLAAARISEVALKELKRCIEDATVEIDKLVHVELAEEEAAEVNNALRQMSLKFHRVIFEESGNQVLIDTLLRLFESFPRNYIWGLLRRAEATTSVEISDHGKIVAALESRNARLARRLMSEHTLNAGKVQVRYLDEIDFWSTGDRKEIIYRSLLNESGASGS